jgi:hypothetical protein
MLPTNANSIENIVAHGPQLRIFGRSARLLWMFIWMVTVAIEVAPIPLLPPFPFYSYCALKGFLFVILGYVAPLSFWRFNALNRGIALAASSAMFVESLQGLLHHGHSFHWYELGVKLVLILLGFGLGLEAVYDSRISLGFIRFQLVDARADK